jgi:competence protein ComEA
LPASAAPSSTASAIPSAHPAADAGAPGDAGAGGGGGAITADGKVILNLAGEEDLRRLPGIGPSKAKAILELRAKLGKFKRAEDLLRVKGLGRKKLARLRPLLLIDPP